MTDATSTTSPCSGATRWRFTGLALVEEGAAGVFVYGRWDRLFGCWRLIDAGLEPVTPASPLFDRLGRWPDPPGPRDDAWHAGRAARAAYFSLIPAAARLTAGRQQDGQWQTLMALWGAGR